MVTEIFHTGSIREQARLHYWNQAANTAFGAMHIQPASRRFSGRMKRRIFRGIELISVESTPVAVEGLSGSSHTGLFLLLNQSGRSRLRQRGRQADLGIGELTALYAHEPYHIESTQEHTAHILYIPGEHFESSLDDHIAITHPSSSCDLLSAFVRRLAALDGNQPGPGNLSQTARDLIALNWPSGRVNHGRVGAAAWERHIQHYVAQHLGEQELNAKRIADGLGITARYVQMIFARMQTTATQYILECRLHLVAERLQHEMTARISDIALEAGFNDLSYFCRCFRNRFGVSARQYRCLEE